MRVGTLLACSAAFTFPASFIAHAESRNEWAIYGGDAANTRYSTLDQINTGTVKDLKAAWALQLGVLKAQESTPLVIADTMYITTSLGPRYVYAVDAKTG